MTSRPHAHLRFINDNDDDNDFIPQAPRIGQNLDKGPAGDKGDFIPRFPKKSKRLNMT